jgi:hypothetical protein
MKFAQGAMGIEMRVSRFLLITESEKTPHIKVFEIHQIGISNLETNMLGPV